MIRENRQILHGDVLEQFKNIADESMSVIIFSPPYLALRDYGIKGQIGLEKDAETYLAVMKKIMDECKRVLKPTGTCWVNIGDSYDDNKCRKAIPELFYIQCIKNGWIARNHIPWIKANAMPSSVPDRFTNKWESVFFFAKTSKTQFHYNEFTAEALDRLPAKMTEGIDYIMVGDKKQSFWHSVKYYFNLHAVRVKPTSEHPIKKSKTKNSQLQHDLDGNVIAESDDPRKGEPSNNKELGNRNFMPIKNKQDITLGPDGKPNPMYKGFNERYANKAQDQFTKRFLDARANGSQHDNPLGHPQGKNPGDLFEYDYSDEELLEWITLCRENKKAWDLAPPDLFYINPKPFPGAHFAVFPVDLPKTILKCACPQQLCTKCDKPRIPIIEHEKFDRMTSNELYEISKRRGITSSDRSNWPGGDVPVYAKKLKGYSKCNCNADFKPGMVLDIFFGAGTTAVAAEQLGLEWCGIELNEDYIKIARKRLDKYKNNHAEEFME